MNSNLKKGITEQLLQKLLCSSPSVNHFISSYLYERKKINKHLTLRQFSSQLGFKNPSFLSDITNSRRKASWTFLTKFMKHTGLTGLEKIFLENLFRGNQDSLAQNRSIEQFWQMNWAKKTAENTDHIDLLVWVILQYEFPEGETKDVYQKHLYKKLSWIIHPSIIRESIDRLILQKTLIKKDGLLTHSKSNNLLLETRDLSKLFTIIHTIIKDETKEASFSYIPCYLTHQQYIDLRKKIYEFAKEITVDIRRVDKTTPEDMRLCVFFNSLTPIAIDSNWKDNLIHSDL